MIDAEKILQKFTRMCALDVVDLWDAPDVVAKYLKTGNGSLGQAAWIAAFSAISKEGPFSLARYLASSTAEIIGAAVNLGHSFFTKGAVNAIASNAVYCTVEAFARSAAEASSGCRSRGGIAVETARNVARYAARDALEKKQAKRLRCMVYRAMRKERKKRRQRREK